MSFALHGIAVAQGIAIGRAHLFSQTTLEVTHYVVTPENRPAELQRFDQAILEVSLELKELEHQIPPGAPAEMAAFLELHRLILKDDMLARVPKQRIQQQGCNAEWALKQQLDLLIAQFEQMEDPYLRQRRDDIWQVGERLLKALMGQPAPSLPPHSEAANSILVAHDLSPADMVLFKQTRFSLLSRIWVEPPPIPPFWHAVWVSPLSWHYTTPGK
jgi:Phosphoenolpyruvate-protein kinase (PTS system EI component in bacteria)